MYPYRSALTRCRSPSYRPFMRAFAGFSILLSVAFVLSSCTKPDVLSVERENLFTLSIGRMEDQIDLFGIEGNPRSEKTRIVMRDGIFYIADGAGAKVSSFTSYGDLLSMIYDADSNPRPLTLRPDDGEGGMATRRAIPYPLNSVGEIAVDSRKNIYVEDRLPVDRRSFDKEKRVLLDGVVLRFDKDGHFVEYLGREGVGGSPFPLIVSMEVAYSDELVVVCRVSTGWEVYWFDPDGELLYLVKIDGDDLPRAAEADSRPSLDAIRASKDSRTLFLKIDYYREEVDDSTNTRAGIGFDGSLVWSMNVEDGVYLDSIEVPTLDSEDSDTDRRGASQRIFSFVGAASGDRLFFLAPQESGYALLVLEDGNKVQRRGIIRVDDDELAFNSFGLSADGILYGLLASDFEAVVAWWRTDRLGIEERL